MAATLNETILELLKKRKQFKLTTDYEQKLTYSAIF